jgi:prevent-host-death family protein
MKTNLVKKIKRNASKLLAELEQDNAAVLITERGKPAAYVVDVMTFEHLQTRVRILEGIARGEQAIQQGRVVTHAQAKRRMRRWLG